MYLISRDTSLLSPSLTPWQPLTAASELAKQRLLFATYQKKQMLLAKAQGIICRSLPGYDCSLPSDPPCFCQMQDDSF